MNSGDILDGRYEILAPLGAGGMGEVYKATHTLLGATRVIKIVRPQIAGNTDAQDRFLREARTATRVQHPNVAALHDFAMLPDGSHYMVWEFIDGENLAQRLRTRGTLPPRQAVRIAIQALKGLEAIHRAGIIHRDISPENLMITPDDAVKIIDLGVAKVDDSDVSQTRTGIFVGKLRYAAPEQLGFMGEGEKIDGRADLYALAMVLVELLTGRPPYEAKSPHEYFLHHAREVPMTTVALPVDLPGSHALQEVLQKALSRNRADRFPDARAFSEALEQIEKTLSDDQHSPTMAIPFDADATWRPPSGAALTTPIGAADVTQRLTAPSSPAPATAASLVAPLRDAAPPAAAVPPSPAAIPVAAPAAVPTVQTPFPGVVASAPPPSSSLKPLLLVAALLILLVGGAAFLFWPKITSLVISQPKSAQSPAVTATHAIAAAVPVPQQAQATVDVTPPIVTNTSAPAAIIPPAVNTPKGWKKADQQQAQLGPRDPVNAMTDTLDSEPRPARVRAVPLYVEGASPFGANQRALGRLRDELRGVTEVALLAGSAQVPVFRALHRHIPALTFDADAPVSIIFDTTRARLGRDREHLAASVTITKNGRPIFRYDLPAGTDPAAAADTFAQTIAEAFE
jgi:serine/threonine protein kinase